MSVTFIYRGDSVTYGTVTNLTTGKTWLDRNLGATQVATAYDDSAAYGHLFQWGRLDDGHQDRESGSTDTQSDTDVPGHSNFIYGSSDWRSPSNDNLWNFSYYTNLIKSAKNQGFRVPTSTEWNAEMATWNSQDATGAYDSPLKLTSGGCRMYSDGTIFNVSTFGYYWANTVSESPEEGYAYHMGFSSEFADIGYFHKAYGYAVRLIYDENLVISSPFPTHFRI